ncbi:MAG: hypothetical protein U0Q07_17785 [Acidimicrobiales bacterium]
MDRFVAVRPAPDDAGAFAPPVAGAPRRAEAGGVDTPAADRLAVGAFFARVAGDAFSTAPPDVPRPPDRPVAAAVADDRPGLEVRPARAGPPAPAGSLLDVRRAGATVVSSWPRGKRRARLFRRQDRAACDGPTW